MTSDNFGGPFLTWMKACFLEYILLYKTYIITSNMKLQTLEVVVSVFEIELKTAQGDIPLCANRNMRTRFIEHLIIDTSVQLDQWTAPHRSRVRAIFH